MGSIRMYCDRKFKYGLLHKLMPLTTLYGGSPSTRVIGNTTTGLIPEVLHPSLLAYQAALAGASYAMTRTEIDAVNNLIYGMVGCGLWTKMNAIYLFIGGTAATNKFNLKDPRDADAAFRLVFNGTWTHSSTGSKGNGSNAWADTFLVPNTTLTTTSGHLAYYSRTQIQEALAIEIGCQNASSTLTAMALARSGTNISSFRYGSDAAGATPTLSGTNSQGLFVGSQTGSGINDRNIYRNGIKGSAQTATGTTSLPTTAKIAINAFNNNNTTRQYYSSKECAYASIGSGLSAIDNRNLYIIVQNFQTALGRQV